MDNKVILFAVFFACALMLAPSFTLSQVVDSKPPDGPADSSPTGLPEEAASVLVAEGAMVSWQSDKPDPGTLVKLRVRGEVLGFLLEEQVNWKLLSGEAKLAAVLVSANLPGQVEKGEFEFASIELDHGDTLQLDIDRGDDVKLLNRLEIQFATTHYLGRVKVTSSADQESFRSVASQQVVFHEITGGQVYRLGEIELDSNIERYLRLEMPSPSSGNVQAVKGWYVPGHKLEVYKTEAALAPMRASREASESVWPILMNPMRLPVAKVKVLADVTGEVRRMHLSTMSGANLGTTVGGEIIWANELTRNYDQISNKWITLKGEPTEGPFAIVVSDDDSPLQLSGVEVYLLEHWLVFEMPEGDNLELWQGAGDEPPIDAAVYSAEDLQAAVLVGTIADWNISKPLSGELVPAPKWRDQPFEFARNGGWQIRMYAYIALALVLLIAGVVLLRIELRRQRNL